MRAQLNGSTSPSWTGRPTRTSQSPMAQALPQAHWLMKWAVKASPSTDSVASSTWCPSDSHSDAVAPTAATQSACTSLPVGDAVMTAMRRGGGALGGRGGEGRPAPRRGPVGVPGDRAGGDVEDRRRIAHRARHHVLGHEPAHHVAVPGRQGVAPPGGFESHQAAARGGDADRPAAVVGMGGGDHARRDRRRRPAGGPAGGVLGVPGIARRAEAPRLGGREDAELGRVGLAADDEAGVDVALRQLLGHRGGVVAREVRALVERRAGELRAEVLQEERHTAERPVGQLARRLRAGAVEELVDDGVEVRVQLLDARDRITDQLRRRDLLGADQLRQCRRVQPCRVLAHAAYGSDARAGMPSGPFRLGPAPLPTRPGAARRSGWPRPR